MSNLPTNIMPTENACNACSQTGGASSAERRQAKSMREVQTSMCYEVRMNMLFCCVVPPMRTGSTPGAHSASHRQTTNCTKKRRVSAFFTSAAYPATKYA